MTTRREEPCDCHVLEGAIIYCPLHGAALALLEALKPCLRALELLPANVDFSNPEFAGFYTVGRDLARSAIAEARP